MMRRDAGRAVDEHGRVIADERSADSMRAMRAQ
jgi:hypothetical protein